MPQLAIAALGYFADPDGGEPGEIEASVIETIAELDAQGLIVGRYKAMATALRRMARAVDYGLAAPKVSVATSNLTKQLYEGLEALPEPAAETGSAFDTLEATIAAMTKDALAS